MRFRGMGAIDDQGLVGIDKALTESYPLRPDFIQPDGMQNGEQPTVQSRSGLELLDALKGAQAGLLHEIVGNVAATGKQEAIAPQPHKISGQAAPDVGFAYNESLRHGFLFQSRRPWFHATIGRKCGVRDRHLEFPFNRNCAFPLFVSVIVPTA
jgi:hypothetical protein